MATDAQVQAQNIAAFRQASRNFAEVMAAVGIGGKLGLQDGAVEVTNEIKRRLSTPGRGRLYRVGRSPTKSDRKAKRNFRSHRASAPGDPPAVNTGRLRSSYTWAAGQDLLGPYVDVGTNVNYAPHLEFGTSKMDARPHFRPAIEAISTKVVEAVVRGIITAEEGAVRRMPAEIR